jgi:hypothetical protein
MSWSVNASGTIAKVMAELKVQFSHPLAEAPAGLTDKGEKETVRRISETIAQALETFDSAKTVSVSAHGHMGFANYETKAGAYQEVTISITPTS